MASLAASPAPSLTKTAAMVEASVATKPAVRGAVGAAAFTVCSAETPSPAFVCTMWQRRLARRKEKPRSGRRAQRYERVFGHEVAPIEFGAGSCDHLPRVYVQVVPCLPDVALQIVG